MIDDVFMVKCFENTNVKYEYVHYVIHRKEKIKDESIYKNRMNVLLISFDSVSASSFKRALPKTFKFLSSFDNFYQFKKYHASGPGTNWNMIPLLGGNF